MTWNRQRRKLLRQFEQRLGTGAAALQAQLAELPRRRRSRLRVAGTVAWVTGAVVVLAAGVYAGRELRVRYKVRRRTPYDFYAHSGDHAPDVEFGVGV